MSAPLRPKDSDAIAQALRELRKRADFQVVFGGESGGGATVLSRVVGGRTNALRDLKVEEGYGLGGRVAHSRRPAVVRDYYSCNVITTHYRNAVSREGLHTIMAVPVVVDGTTRAVLYGALRQVSDLGDRIQQTFHSVAGELGTELRIRDDVDRRLAMAEMARAEGRSGIDATDLERLRVLHGELRAIAAELNDDTLKNRLLAAGSALAGLGNADTTTADAARPASKVTLSPREIDVLSQVALGCSNAEVGKRLSLSPETIKAYLRNIGAKLETKTRMESVARARLLGLLP